ncbi:MAG: hypothetical protein O7B99_02875 [Planctomycetota bacterium]|nr:hypothetical protein [Planctomycetota bacterium]
MSTFRFTREDAPSPREDAILGLLLLLPGMVLAWPGEAAPLLFDPYPHLGGAGLAALAAAPAGLMVALRRLDRPTPARFLLLVVIACGCLSASFDRLTDVFEGRRALVSACTAVVMLSGGSALRERGRAVFARGLVVLSALWTGRALLGDEVFAGVLGNTGALSQAALPGALIGAWFAAKSRGAWSIAGWIAILLFAWHAGRAPVIAGVVAAGIGLGASAVLSPAAREQRRTRPVLLGLAALLVVAFLGFRAMPPAGEAPRSLGTQVAAETGGFEVRARIWKSLGAAFAANPVLGFGPGQFQADYPPYRDPREIVLSNHGSCEDHANEVNHGHNDWLHGVAELGGLGGSFWITLLLTALVLALRSLRAPSALSGALGAALLALLANAAVHSPLFFHAASSTLAFALLGVLAGPAVSESGRRSWLCLTLLLPVLFGPWVGWPLVRHGHALSERSRLLDLLLREVPLGDAELFRLRATDAVRFAPWSTAARELDAESIQDWEVILALRPHSQRALQNVGLGYARQRRFDDARERWNRVLELDPAHPLVLRNLVNLELDAGEREAAHARLAVLNSTGCLQRAWLDGIGIRLLLDGRSDEGLELLTRYEERLREPVGGLVHALFKEAEQQGLAERASALESAAHHLWALEHVAEGDYATAVRSYRQALRPTYARHRGGAPLLRCVLAAVQVLAGSRDDALRTLDGLERDPIVWKLLPHWALAELEREMLYGP